MDQPLREEGYTLPQLKPLNAVGGDTHSIDDAEHETHMDRSVLQSLPGELAVGDPLLHPAVNALRHSPKPLIDNP